MDCIDNRGLREVNFPPEPIYLPADKLNDPPLFEIVICGTPVTRTAEVTRSVYRPPVIHKSPEHGKRMLRHFSRKRPMKVIEIKEKTCPGTSTLVDIAGKLVASDLNVCRFAGSIRPRGCCDCPRCRSAVEEGWKALVMCGLSLETSCRSAKNKPFSESLGPHCGALLTYSDPNENNKKKK